jgi:hypothetical protein
MAISQFVKSMTRNLSSSIALRTPAFNNLGSSSVLRIGFLWMQKEGSFW